MKRLTILLAILPLLFSCKEEFKYWSPSDGPLRSYIPRYGTGEMAIAQGISSPGTPELLLWGCFNFGGIVFQSPETGGKGEMAEKFLEIAERNGDRSYNKYEPFETYAGRECCADNFKSAELICIDGYFDDAHPKGASLNDITELTYVTYAAFIRNGYTGSPYEIKSKLLSELTEDDLTMIKPSFKIQFTTEPPSEPCELQLTMVTTGGKEYIAVCKWGSNRPIPDPLTSSVPGLDRR